MILENGDKPARGCLVPNCIQAPLINVGKGDSWLGPSMQQPFQKPLCEPQIGIRSACAKKPKRFAGVVFSQRDSSAHFVGCDLSRVNVAR